MEESKVRGLQFLALQLVGAVAVVHFAVGSAQLGSIVANGLLVDYLTGQVFVHPRAFLFVTSSVALFAGIVATARGYLPRRRAYQLGIGLMVTYLVGYLAWHTVLNHGLALDPTASTTTPHSHGGLLGTVVSHYVHPLVDVLTASTSGTPGSGKVLLGVVSKSLELAALVVLAVLLRVDPAVQVEKNGSLDLGVESETE